MLGDGSDDTGVAELSIVADDTDVVVGVASGGG